MSGDPLTSMSVAAFFEKVDAAEIQFSRERWERADNKAVVILECADGTNSFAHGVFADQMSALVWAETNIRFLNDDLDPGDLPYIAKVLPLEPIG